MANWSVRFITGEVRPKNSEDTWGRNGFSTPPPPTPKVDAAGGSMAPGQGQVGLSGFRGKAGTRNSVIAGLGSSQSSPSSPRGAEGKEDTV